MSYDLDREAQSALAEALAGPFSVRAEVRVTPVGMLAYGAMVSCILLSTAALIWAARRPKR